MPPPPPEGVELTPEEWDAVRRLRGERTNEPEWPAAEWRSPAPEAPAAPAEEPASTGEPLAPVEPSPPPQQTVPPAQETVPTAPESAVVAPTGPAASAAAVPTWGGGPARERSPSHAGAAVAALVVVALVMAVLAALTGLRVSDRHARNSASTAALSAASAGVATVLSYNYRSLDHDFSAAEALLTPAFRKAYVATTAKAVQPLAAKYKAVSTAQVSAAGVISASSTRATVLVFVSQTVTNTQLSAPRLDRSRIQVELVHTHGSWLINKLTPI